MQKISALAIIFLVTLYGDKAFALSSDEVYKSLRFAGGLSDTIQEPQGGTSQLISVNASGNRPQQGCLKFGFGGQMSALMNTDVTAIANNMAQLGISYFSMKTLCDFSPTLCQILQHMQTLTSFAAKFNQASCQQIQQMAMQDGQENNARRNSEVMDCVEKRGGGSNPSDEILQSCMNEVKLYDTAGNATSSYSPLKNMTTTLGWDAKDSRAEMLTALVGTIEFDVNGGITGGLKPGGIGRLHETATKLARIPIKENIENAMNGKPTLPIPIPTTFDVAGMRKAIADLQKALAKINAGAAGTGAAGTGAAGTGAAGTGAAGTGAAGTGADIKPRVIDLLTHNQWKTIGLMDPISRKVATDKLAEATGLAMMLDQYQRAVDALNAAAISGGAQGGTGKKKAAGADVNQALEQLRRSKEIMEAYIIAYKAKNEIITNTVNDVLSTARAVREGIQQRQLKKNIKRPTI